MEVVWLFLGAEGRLCVLAVRAQAVEAGWRARWIPAWVGREVVAKMIRRTGSETRPRDHGKRTRPARLLGGYGGVHGVLDPTLTRAGDPL